MFFGVHFDVASGALAFGEAFLALGLSACLQVLVGFAELEVGGLVV